MSFYHWRIKRWDKKRGESPPSFAEFARAVISGDRKRIRAVNGGNFSNRPFYEINGTLAVDHVYRFEDLHSELQAVFHRLEIPWDGDLPHTKGNVRPKRSYREYYDQALRQECERAFAREMELFGYEF